MWLQCQEKYDSVAEFNPAEGIVRRYSRQVLGARAPKIENIDGWFSDVKNSTFILYKYKDNIFFRANDKEFILDNKTEVEVFGPREKRKLYVKHNGLIIFDTAYELTREGAIPNDPTPFIDKEDFDFGLFVSNISKNQKRKDVLLKSERGNYGDILGNKWGRT